MMRRRHPAEERTGGHCCRRAPRRDRRGQTVGDEVHRGAIGAPRGCRRDGKSGTRLADRVDEGPIREESSGAGCKDPPTVRETEDIAGQTPAPTCHAQAPEAAAKSAGSGPGIVPDPARARSRERGRAGGDVPACGQDQAHGRQQAQRCTSRMRCAPYESGSPDEFGARPGNHSVSPTGGSGPH